MTAVRPLAALVVLAFASSACELVAGIGDRKLASGGTTGNNPSFGGHSGSDTAASGGRSGPGGTAGSGAGPGSGGALPTGGATGNGGNPLGGASGSGGASADGGTPGSGGSTVDGGTINTGGVPNTGGTARTGGITGQGGAKTDGAMDAQDAKDAAADVAGCSVVGGLGTGNGLLGEYFPNTSLTGMVFSRIDATINYDWASNAPEMGLPTDGFSVRWTGQVQPRFSGRYTFYTNTDDGVRLWINGSQIINDWNDHMATENSGVADLVAGQKYDLKMEYYESAQLAVAQLSWSSNCQAREIIPPSQLYSPPPVCDTIAAGTGTGLVGQYFDNQDLTALRVTRTDPMVSFAWADGTSPDPTIAVGSYSVRWTGQLQARSSGFTTLSVISDDGARLFVNDALVIDDWNAHQGTEDMATIATTAGQTYNVRLEYFEQSGGGQVQLLWGSPCQTKEIIPQTQLYPSYAGMVCTTPGAGTGIGLRGDYYNNMDFTSFAVTHPAEAINFDWGTGAADPSVGPDTFSVRWTGKLLARYTGGTTFRTWSDDGVRLWIDGQLIVDNWTDHQAAENAGLAYLVAGQLHDVKLEFHENLENALIKLLWFSPCQTEEAIPASRLFPPGYVPPDAGIDAGPDASADAGPDAGPDLAAETEAGAPDGGGPEP